MRSSYSVTESLLCVSEAAVRGRPRTGRAIRSRAGVDIRPILENGEENFAPEVFTRWQGSNLFGKSDDDQSPASRPQTDGHNPTGDFNCWIGLT